MTEQKAKVITTCVSKSKAVTWQGSDVDTGIFKLPVQGKIKVNRLNMEGDEQADLTVHGGPDKAVYSYASEYYEYWKNELPARELPFGMFGENLTTAGLDESSVNIGDKFQIGTSVLVVSQTRMPCFKLGIKFGDQAIIKHFYDSARWGLYFSVVTEGELQVGDEIIYLGGDELKVKVSDVIRLFTEKVDDLEEFDRVLASNLAPQMKGFVKSMRRRSKWA